MCVALLTGAEEGVCSMLRTTRHGRASGEKGEKAVRNEVIVWTGIDIVNCFSRILWIIMERARSKSVSWLDWVEVNYSRIRISLTRL